MAVKQRSVEELQNEMGQYTFGLGELEYNYSQYDTNRARVIQQIKDIATELQHAQRKAQEDAVKKHEQTLASVPPLPTESAPATELQ